MKIKYLFIIITLFGISFSSCESDDSDNIIVIDGDGKNQDEENSDEDSDSGDNDSTDTGDVYFDRDIFEAYNCYKVLDETTLDVITWNIEWFPNRENNTITRLADLIKSTNADIIAAQEIAEPAQLNNLMALLPGWGYKYYDVRGDQELAYFYKYSEITSIIDLSIIYPDNTSAFYRPPVVTKIEHVNGQQVTLINIHLKCCGGTENINRRTEASRLLKKYIDEQLPNEKVIVLGDYNDLIDDSRTTFSNFIADSANYYFADMEISEGPSEYRSYPSWDPNGSHLDHILITNELFNDVQSVTTLTYDKCISSYEYYISDHFPVMVSIK